MILVVLLDVFIIDCAVAIVASHKLPSPRVSWCPEPDSNRHGLASTDFKALPDLPSSPPRLIVVRALDSAAHAGQVSVEIHCTGMYLSDEPEVTVEFIRA
jgi:hypothetical protein